MQNSFKRLLVVKHLLVFWNFVMNKTYISAAALLTDSYELGLNIYESGYRPDFVVGIWRGGSPIGIAVHEILSYLGVEADHFAIRTSSYSHIGFQDDTIQVYGLDYLEQKLHADHQLLLVDDVFDSGRSLLKVSEEISIRCGSNTPHIKIATPYFKPRNNKTHLHPDFYLHTSDDWLVFPHELMGLNIEEAITHKIELQPLADRVRTLKTI